MHGRFILLGNVIADLVMDVPHLPERGGDVLASRSELTAGGGHNTLVAARRLGAPALYAGLHGSGPHGDLVRAALAREGIATLLPPRVDGDSGFTVALIDGQERTFVTSFGVERAFTGSDLAALRAALRPHDLVHLSGYLLALPEVGPLIADFVNRLPDGVTLTFDPGPLVTDIPAAVMTAVLSHTKWLSCNTREARIMCGLDGWAATEALRERLPADGGVVVRAGEHGCWLAAPGAVPVLVPAFPVRAVDTNGAGDCHCGAFLTLIGQAYAPSTAARAANAAAAFAVSRRGPATAPRRAELLKFVGSDPLGDALRAGAGPRRAPSTGGDR
jgi:sugar/nucleoside kinase (ribokinase family)